ncbi:glycerate kinase [Variovorax sp. M-6]|uniref:glycerate kinase n=1 Tax=Variovorax sp. M-6 TaxID=3233041 RepID=UPI003F9C78EF
MNFSKILVPVGGLVLLGVAYRSYGWAGVALVGGAIVMFLLMHFNRTMQVLKRAADRPIGTVASAVMLNAKLKPKATLLHVIAMTRALGEQRSPKDEQPELFRWTDAGGSWVDATFVGGKLTEWTLVRPQVAEDDASPADAPSADAVKPGAADALRPPV